MLEIGKLRNWRKRNRGYKGLDHLTISVMLASETHSIGCKMGCRITVSMAKIASFKSVVAVNVAEDTANKRQRANLRS